MSYDVVVFDNVATGEYVLSPNLNAFSEVNSAFVSVDESRLMFDTYTRYSLTNESVLRVHEARKGLDSVLTSRSRSWMFVAFSGAAG